MDGKETKITRMLNVKYTHGEVNFELNTYDAMTPFKIDECEYSFDGFKTGGFVKIEDLIEIKDAIIEFLEAVEFHNSLIDMREKEYLKSEAKGVE